MESAQKVFEESKRLVNLGRYRDALNCLHRLSKDMSEGYFQSSFVYHRLCNRNKSSKLLIKCLLIDPRHLKALFLLQYLFFRSGNVNTALFILKRCIYLAPNSILFQRQLIHYFSLSGQTEKSVQISKNLLCNDKENLQTSFDYADSLESADPFKKPLRFSSK